MRLCVGGRRQRDHLGRSAPQTGAAGRNGALGLGGALSEGGVFDLERFRRAQDGPHGGFVDALRELESGRKTGHWIWYVFPQLARLGRSSTAVYYGLSGSDEALAYLCDPVLVGRLIAVAAAVRAHLAGRNPPRLEDLMGSRIDALKLVSCMTLFSSVARAMHAENGRPELATIADHAEAILGFAAAQGYGRCASTDSYLRCPTT